MHQLNHRGARALRAALEALVAALSTRSEDESSVAHERHAEMRRRAYCVALLASMVRAGRLRLLFEEHVQHGALAAGASVGVRHDDTGERRECDALQI